MKPIRPVALFLATAMAIGVSAWAIAADPHTDHHPAAPASDSASAPVPGMMSGAAMPGSDAMADQMTAMRAMHEKMMAASTPKERQALMAEHMKLMQAGMGMMAGMAPGGQSGMNCDMAERHQMMEERMEMMQMMMQMMMDRLPEASTK